MFVGVARLTLQIPDSGSLKAKRQILRRVTDRLKARFNASVAEVDDQDLWQRATVAVAVVGNDQRHVNEQVDKIIHAVDEMYVAPLIGRQTEIIPLGATLQAAARPTEAPFDLSALIKGDRSLAEAEGMADWDHRHDGDEGPERAAPARGGGEDNELSLDEARAKARALRRPRDWEKKK